MRIFISVILTGLWLAVPLHGQEAIYVIRHAEKAHTGDDPALLPEGRDRASGWARLFASAELDMVITSTARRAIETGTIIAGHLDLPIATWTVSDTAGLVDMISFDHPEDTVLVVAHTETIPGLVRLFGVPRDVEVEPNEFGTLFIVLDPFTEVARVLALQMP